MTPLGPNTNAPPSILKPDCILCGGEDRAEFLAALTEALGSPPTPVFAYRCYEFWIHRNVTFILTAIGTGTLEPLIWEILSAQIIRRIILIGTAGAAEDRTLQPGVAFAIDRAFSAGTSLDAEPVDQPLRPDWEIPTHLQTATSVSTDYFYGYSPRLLNGQYPLTGGNLERRYRELSGKVDLIDMEVAQFYCFCERFNRGVDLRYLAIKSPANVVGDLTAQTQNSPQAIAGCARAAMSLLLSGESDMTKTYTQDSMAIRGVSDE